jgi:hypothetical protein
LKRWGKRGKRGKRERGKEGKRERERGRAMGGRQGLDTPRGDE